MFDQLCLAAVPFVSGKNTRERPSRLAADSAASMRLPATVLGFGSLQALFPEKPAHESDRNSLVKTTSHPLALKFDTLEPIKTALFAPSFGFTE